MIEIKVTENLAGERLDKVLKKCLPEAPDPFLYKMLRKKNITLNHRKAEGGVKTSAGDTIQFFLSDETYQKMKGAPQKKKALSVPSGFPKIEVLYEDQDVLLFVKPAGVLSQKNFEDSFSVNEWVLLYAAERGLVSGSDYELFRPSVVNRLDYNTGGIMAAGLSLKGLQVLSDLFRNRTLAKFYYALVVGQVIEKGLLKSYLVKDERKNEVRIYSKPVDGGKEIRTEYEPLRYDPENNLTLLKVHLLSGRSHQIRAHLSSIGHPILGDPKYGDPAMNLRFHKNEQCLLSYRMTFPECELQGISGKTFEISVPLDWPVRTGAEQ